MAKKTKMKEAPAHVGLKKPAVTEAEKERNAVNPKAARKKFAKALGITAKPAKPSAAKHVHQSNTAPTAEIADLLQSAFDHFNTSLFGSKLTSCVLTLDRLRKYVGYFHPKQWTTDRKAGSLDGSHHQITLDPERLRDKGDKVVLSTLAHEMMHQIVWDATFAETGKFKKAYHCKDWVAGMEAIGLKPVIIVKGKPSDKRTGANATHTIEKGGDFDKAADVLLGKGFKLNWLLVPKPERKESDKPKKAGVKAKFTCGECEANAWGKPDLKITCTECDVPMKPGDDD